jgi:hypothetical protein
VRAQLGRHQWRPRRSRELGEPYLRLTELHSEPYLATCGFWCMVARWCARTSSSELTAAMVAWFSASVETEGGKRDECRQQQRVGMALEAPRSDTQPPHQCTVARWHARPGSVGHQAQAEMAIRLAISA